MVLHTLAIDPEIQGRGAASEVIRFCADRKQEITMKPIVGIMPLWDEKKNSIWMLPGYMNGISEAGAVPVMFPLVTEERDLKQLVGLCDGFLFTGGHDVSPELYHEEPLEDLVITCARRDEMEAVVLRQAIAAGKPVLGICRGIQFINAALGGTLYQDLPLQHPSGVVHHQNPPYEAPSHNVRITEGTPLHKCLGIETLPVNSLHHQAIKELAPELETMAVSPDGLVEAVYRPGDSFLWAVQWHPEFAYTVDENSRRIFRAFVKAMGTED